MSKPIIGIVAKHYKEGHPKDTVIHESIKRAVFAAGGIGIGIVPPCTGKVRSVDMVPEERMTKAEQEDLIAQLELCDGVVLQGGGFNDAYEVFAAQYCLEHRIPTLGICAGYFSMIRAAGGKTKLLDKDELKRHGHAEHMVQITEAPLRKIMGCGSLRTNSRHISKVVNTGSLIRAAVAEDGICEAAYGPEQFYLAVQFHPEDLTAQEPFRNIFRALINAAQVR